MKYCLAPNQSESIVANNNNITDIGQYTCYLERRRLEAIDQAFLDHAEDKMGTLRNIIIAIAGISFITFVALFGQLPALRRTPIGWLQRLLCLHIPSGMRSLDQRATGGAITIKSKRLGQYLFYEKNPIVLASPGSTKRLREPC